MNYVVLKYTDIEIIFSSYDTVCFILQPYLKGAGAGAAASTFRPKMKYFGKDNFFFSLLTISKF